MSTSTERSSDQAHALIIGGGLAGLSAARALQEAKVGFDLIEASDILGGRVRTDVVDGFQLDRGFQVLLTAYPECRAQLDYNALHLRSFRPGALIRFKNQWLRVTDPWREPKSLWTMALSPVGSIRDKVGVATLRWRANRGSLDSLYERPATMASEALRSSGCSQGIVDRFFRPFLGGVFLEHDLTTSSRMMDFVLRWFAQGDAAVPAHGMGQIPAQLAAALPAGSVHLNRRVAGLSRDGEEIIADFGGDGEPIRTRHLLLAVEEPAARRLLAGIGLDKRLERRGPMRGVTAMYFAAPAPPMKESMLLLNGDGPSAGLVNNVAFMSEISNAYAPEGQALVSISVIGVPDLPQSRLEESVRTQMSRWFGDDTVAAWSHLATYRIHHALPDQGPPALEPVVRSPELAERVYVAGDYRETGSIHGAMHSGRLAGQELAQAASTLN